MFNLTLVDGQNIRPIWYRYPKCACHAFDEAIDFSKPFVSISFDNPNEKPLAVCRECFEKNTGILVSENRTLDCQYILILVSNSERCHFDCSCDMYCADCDNDDTNCYNCVICSTKTITYILHDTKGLICSQFDVERCLRCIVSCGSGWLGISGLEFLIAVRSHMFLTDIQITLYLSEEDHKKIATTYTTLNKLFPDTVANLVNQYYF
jgi:hypothetical protein